MSKSPLSGAFSGSSEPAKKKKKNGAILLIAGIALTSSIGGVFAANSITLGTNNEIEFGQGVASTTVCDTSFTTSMTQALSGTSTNFVARVVEIGDIAAACQNTNDLRVQLLQSDNTVITSTVFRPTTGTYSWDVGTTYDAGTVGRISVTTED
jgi:hypothetical protein